jgi:hypothetical protein
MPGGTADRASVVGAGEVIGRQIARRLGVNRDNDAAAMLYGYR